jgi:hypothetical protein
MRRLILSATVLALLAACGGSPHHASKAVVEQMIHDQLPQQNNAADPSHPVFVNRVTCVDKGQGGFDCIARVSGVNAVGNIQPFNVSVTASCDDENCTWHTE